MTFINYTKEKHKRSLTKSIMWRIIGILFLALVTYIMTGNWVTTTLVTVIHHGAFIFGYYIHERFWLWFKYFRKTKWRPLLRVILYEIVLGNLVLGLITWIIIGDIKQATAVTLIYTGNKLWMYVVYDKIWEKIKWGKIENKRA